MCFSAMQSKALDAARMAAFALRLAGAARFLDAGGAMGLLAVLEKLLRWAIHEACLEQGPFCVINPLV